MITMRSYILSIVALARLGEAGYALSDDYHPKNFLDKFNFYADKDPTEGFVSLQSRAAGLSSGIIQQRPNSVYLGVDSTNHAPDGRASLRLESKQSYSTGLVIADIAHMPDSTCGTWPAFWSIGQKIFRSKVHGDVTLTASFRSGLAVPRRDRHHRRRELSNLKLDDLTYTARMHHQQLRKLLWHRPNNKL